MERTVLTLDRLRTDPAPEPVLTGWYDPNSVSFTGAVDATSAEGLLDDPVNDPEVASFKREGA
jgi:hypothetical protein